ncbi:hypothetical protein HNY73_009909 [Argiope bruennichi]|uniref:Uncharacterized protein n=1 Tax=Argiope bruennichi TaxID=94029 RepID=A0A8T0FDT1_ARGBR|nr:hypothetical protein HNY73_009909 [Argiope bruennichi]
MTPTSPTQLNGARLSLRFTHTSIQNTETSTENATYIAFKAIAYRILPIRHNDIEFGFLSDSMKANPCSEEIFISSSSKPLECCDRGCRSQCEGKHFIIRILPISSEDRRNRQAELLTSSRNRIEIGFIDWNHSLCFTIKWLLTAQPLS